MKNKILVLLLCIYSHANWAQLEPQVDLATGTANVTIPLYMIQEKDLQFPVALSHTANGVRYNHFDGWVGQNWSISVEAIISRDVRGIADDHLGTGADTRKGWLRGDMGTRIKNYTFTSDNNPATCNDEVPNWNFLNTFQYQDTEPDVFSVELPGLSFQFYFDENKQYHVVPYQDVQITYTTNAATGKIESFTVTDSKGVKYIFQDAEKVTRGAFPKSLSRYCFRRKSLLDSASYSYNYAWRITSIVSPISGHIDFNYTESIVDDSLHGANKYNFPFNLHNTWHSQDAIKYTNKVTRKILQKINSSTTQLDFTSYVSPTLTKLNSIKISETRGTIKLIKQFDFNYSTTYYTDTQETYMVATRSFLNYVNEKTPNEQRRPYTFEYNGIDPSGNLAIPFPSAKDYDIWGFSIKDITTGTLKKAMLPMGAYIALFYEPHQYLDKSTNSLVTGGGIRIRKTISHDGINSTGDRITEYEYLESNGQTSGKLLYTPRKYLSLVYLDYLRLNSIDEIFKVRYPYVVQQVNNNAMSGPADKYFALTADQDLASEENSNIQSTVAYNRVSLKRTNAGRTIYEFDLPAMNGDVTANNNEWQASVVDIARPSTGTAACHEKGSIPLGVNLFPYPPNPNYDFARALLKRTTDVNEQGITVREVNYDYQRIYSGSEIRKIYALAFEDFLTYYHNGTSYVNGRMFLYSKYAINTDVATVLKTKTETIYNPSDMANSFQTVASYYYDSPNHRELSKVVRKNSDQNQLITKFKYVKDYSISTPANNTTAAIAQLLADHRTTTIIESTSSHIKNNIENYTSCSLSLFQKINGKVFPYQQLVFESPEGNPSFVPASVQTTSGTSNFQYDTSNYVLTKTFLSYDNLGNLTAAVGRDKIINAVAWGYGGTLPILTINNANLNESAFSDFETTSNINFLASGFSPAYVTGRTGTNALNFSSTVGHKLVKNITNTQSKKYLFSCWINASASSNLTIKLRNGTTDLITPVQVPFQAFSGWKYYTILINTSSLPASFDTEITTGTNVSIDDIAFYPAHAAISSYAYDLPFGKSSETNTRGVTTYYTYDEWGRTKLVKDQDQNILNKYDYQIRP